MRANCSSKNQVLGKKSIGMFKIYNRSHIIYIYRNINESINGLDVKNFYMMMRR